ncbi:YciC family protein [Candidatus Schneideria nysicola]|uniref:YciC family protein n=1 Tax=Candidatus Schneideria nysicola TaxID=1081631 RepID=UPI001CAA53D6|nr:YciC family protein [Candidatus Schneideria nysicola]UAJ65858.1 UPF0259 family protein [Candidatus Schneideria nysicola]
MSTSPIKVKILYRDVINFFYNQLSTILLIVCFSTLINIILEYIFTLYQENPLTTILNNIDLKKTTTLFSVINSIQQLPIEQQRIIFKTSILTTFSYLISNVILISSLLIMIRQFSNYNPISAFQALILSIPKLSNLFVLIFFTTLIIQIGFLLAILPGIILTITFCLAPIILINDNIGIVQSMYISVKIALANIRLITPAILIWFILKVIILISIKITILLSLPSLYKSFIFIGINNIILSLLLIYLYRLYILICSNTHYK